MGKSVPKTSALIVSAIRKLREAQGSTSKEIMNFITSEYAVPGATVKRQLQAALKRGLEYGILKCQHGHYTLSTDTAGGQIPTGGEGSNLVEKCGGRRRKNRKCKKTRRCARNCTRRRRRKRSSCGRKRRHSRRKRGCSKRHRAIDGDNLALGPLDNCRTRNEINAQRSHHSRISNHSRLRSRSRSHSGSGHSSAIDMRETSMDRRGKGAE